ncbi:HET-domain-containing protein, partial [Rhizodiscina lignyota]
MSGNTGSEEALSKCQQWLKDCDENHERCRQYLNSPLPSRVLDLGDAKANLCKDVKLHESAPSERASYTTLSYCWGGEKFITTTASTLSERKANIDWSELPAVFQDIVTFCRRIGVRYLWIDALCILQDSKDDWRKEASRMKDYYSNAYISLSAAKASRPSEGCYTGHLPWGYKSHTLRSPPKAKFPYAIHVRRTRYFERPPIHERAWCFQEHELPSRVLMFRGMELQWYCYEHAICECGNHEGAREETEDRLPREDFTTVQSHGDARLEWYRSIDEYTDRNLTVQSDILPALSGLAGKMAERHPGARYLAGLWEDTLISDLM